MRRERHHLEVFERQSSYNEHRTPHWAIQHWSSPHITPSTILVQRCPYGIPGRLITLVDLAHPRMAPSLVTRHMLIEVDHCIILSFTLICLCTVGVTKRVTRARIDRRS